MKETGTTHWASPNTDATNSSGFTGLPGGFRYNADGTFSHLGFNGSWWSSTEGDTTTAWFHSLNYDSGSAYRDTNGEANGYSVRCLRD